MCKPVQFIIKNAQSLSIIGGVVFGCVAWFYSVNGLPHRMDSAELRVSQLEKEVSELKASIAEQSVKLDLLLNGLYEVRGVLLKGK